MMVGYDHVDAKTFSVFDLFDGGNTGINGYNKCNTLRMKLANCFAIDAVSFIISAGDIITRAKSERCEI